MKLFYDINDVVKRFERYQVKASRIREYEKYFGLKIARQSGDRIYKEKDLLKFDEIFYLVEEEKLTLEGAKERLKKRKKNKEEKGDLVDRLLKMKEFLESIKDNIA